MVDAAGDRQQRPSGECTAASRQQMRGTYIPLFFLERYDFAPAAAAAGSADLMRSSRSSSWPRPSAAAGFRITGQSFTTLCTEHCVFQVVFPGKSGQL
jgi:hypothetical protein